jgi:hypothetical protein
MVMRRTELYKHKALPFDLEYPLLLRVGPCSQSRCLATHGSNLLHYYVNRATIP